LRTAIYHRVDGEASMDLNLRLRDITWGVGTKGLFI
jgi:hypothetical protein